MSKMKDGGLAFPGEYSADAETIKALREDTGVGLHELKNLLSKHGGMSLRDYFAGQALTGFMGRRDWATCARIYAKESYLMADAMLAAREN